MASDGAGKGYLVENWRKLEMQVADALVRRDALATPTGKICKHCPPCWCKRMNVVVWYIVLTVFGLMFLSLTIAFGVGIVAPYKHASGFLRTTCTNIETLYDANNRIHCSCGSAKAPCNSYYPCLKIFVKYKRHDGVDITAMLQATQYHGPCTITPYCSSNEWINKEEVRIYKHDFGMVGLIFPCLYNPKKGSTEVIEHLSGSDFGNIHLLLWPLAFTLVAFGLLCLTYNTCGCEYIFRRQPPEDVKNGADQLLNMGITDMEKLNPEELERLLKQCCPESVPALS